jgi:hypothetical protein
VCFIWCVCSCQGVGNAYHGSLTSRETLFALAFMVFPAPCRVLPFKIDVLRKKPSIVLRDSHGGHGGAELAPQPAAALV